MKMSIRVKRSTCSNTIKNDDSKEVLLEEKYIHKAMDRFAIEKCYGHCQIWLTITVNMNEERPE